MPCGHQCHNQPELAPGAALRHIWRARPGGGSMHGEAQAMLDLEASIGVYIRIIGVGIDIFGVVIIVAGLAWATALFLQRRMGEPHYDSFKTRIGRSLLLGLEMLVAADIVKTIAIEPTFMSLGVLGGLVAIRTFLSWTLVLEIEGRWPWQSSRATSHSE
jgi:uncharacterized membrane protein